MMNRMMKAEAFYDSQAHERVCILLHADDTARGGFMERLSLYMKL